MATYTVTNKYLIDDYAVLQLLTPTELEVGQSITVASVDATFNGTHPVRALSQYHDIGVDTEGDLLYDVNVPIANQVLYAKTAADVSRTAASGTLTSTPTCSWITAADIEEAVKQITEFFSKNDVSFTIKVAPKNTNFAKQVVDYATSNNADLIMIMTDPDQSLARFILGSWDEQIIFNGSQIPVMCINPRKLEWKKIVSY